MKKYQTPEEKEIEYMNFLESENNYFLSMNSEDYFVSLGHPKDAQYEQEFINMKHDYTTFYDHAYGR